jgi:hypothetical protein
MQQSGIRSPWIAFYFIQATVGKHPRVIPSAQRGILYFQPHAKKRFLGFASK